MSLCKISLGKISLCKISLGKLSLGKISLGKISLCKISLGKISLGKISLGKLSLGKISLGKISLCKISLGKLSLGQSVLFGQRHPWYGIRFGACTKATPRTTGGRSVQQGICTLFPLFWSSARSWCLGHARAGKNPQSSVNAVVLQCASGTSVSPDRCVTPGSGGYRWAPMDSNDHFLLFVWPGGIPSRSVRDIV